MFKVRIVTPRGLYKVFETEILNVQTSEGQIGILRNHMPIVAILNISSMTTVENDGRNSYAIAGGTVYFQNNLATILTDAIERSDEIDIRRAKQAKERAEELIAKKEGIDVKRAEVALKRALNRINTAS
jgi:F-type H+-transporting ATPase subunit epsilon